MRLTPGQRLRAWRWAKNLSQRDAADFVGVSQATWWDWENNRKIPLVTNAIDIERISEGECPVTMYRRVDDAAMTRRVWESMLARCENEKNAGFKNYGARGIHVCSRWHDFNAFYADMGPRPMTGRYSIDRIDNDKSYTCGKCRDCKAQGATFNCRWAQQVVQANNRRCGTCDSCRNGAPTNVCEHYDKRQRRLRTLVPENTLSKIRGTLPHPTVQR